MKSIIWKRGFFILTLISSVLLGFWGATKSFLYMEFLWYMSWQKMAVMGIRAPRPLTTELYFAAEFLICFAVPFGLTWLIYFVVTRFVFPNSTIKNDKPSKQSSLT